MEANREGSSSARWTALSSERSQCARLMCVLLQYFFFYIKGWRSSSLGGRCFNDPSDFLDNNREIVVNDAAATFRRPRGGSRELAGRRSIVADPLGTARGRGDISRTRSRTDELHIYVSRGEWFSEACASDGTTEHWSLTLELWQICSVGVVTLS